MSRKNALIISCIILAALVIFISCSGSGGVTTPTIAGGYVGSHACASCHRDIYDTFVFSGHPFMLNEIEEGQAPKFPYTEVPSPPSGFTWDKIAYVVGGFKWRAEFIGTNGSMLTGDTQYNIETRQWSPFYTGESKTYDCAACHTTGYSPAGHQDNRTGIQGTWAIPGVQCEACHGPGSTHVANSSGSSINVGINPNDACESCHSRGDGAVLDAGGGFIRNHQQYEEFTASAHAAEQECSSCHNPHASVVHRDSGHNPGGGFIADCEECHAVQVTFQQSSIMKAANVTCRDCHMPPMVKSAIGDQATFKADLATHLFKINIDPNAQQFSTDGTESMDYITIPYACQRCHIDGGKASPYPLDALASRAEKYHELTGEDEFVGSDRCIGCHWEVFDEYEASGHPYMLNDTSDDRPPDYPYSSVPNPPDGYSWGDVSHVIGGYGRMARFLDADGDIITGDAVQFNLGDEEWASYSPGVPRNYDCGECHTTGYNPDENFEDFPGIIGRWNEPGVTCEACHGPAGAHLILPVPDTINIEMPAEDRCAGCHTRADVNIIEASGGFSLHNQQYDEMRQSQHGSMLCTECHDSHMSSTYSLSGTGTPEGLISNCEDCHTAQAAFVKSITMKNDNITCVDCHMAPLVKSAEGDASIFTGDMGSHLFKINPDPDAPQFSPDGTQTEPYITVAYACQRCHMEGGGASIISYNALAKYAEKYHEPIDPDTYVGSDLCGACHQEPYAQFLLTGHPHSVKEIDGQAPEFPYSTLPTAPPGNSWGDVSYTIGGYGWMARYVGQDGNIITGSPGDRTQYNLATQNWVDYRSGELAPFDCGRCHTTGYDPDKDDPDWPPGIYGTWSEPGVQCEACHGPGGEHIGNQTPGTINRDGPPDDACANCHIRGETDVLDAWGGFTKSQQQYEELEASPHNHYDCTECHIPHTSAVYDDPVYNPDKGIGQSCDGCHPAQAATVRSPLMEAVGVTCEDCHMAPMVKSAIGDISIFTGDVSSHLFTINTNPDAPQFSTDGLETMPYITVAYACRRCHIDGGGASVISFDGLTTYAKDYHTLYEPTDYVGSHMCETCHQNEYDRSRFTSHSYQLQKVDGQAPVYPFSTVPNPPPGYTWDDVSYVIGGSGWKTRFIGNDGYIITGNTGDTTQYNIANQEWVEYFAGEQKQYDCGACHTTGYSPSGNQDGLPGIAGTWNEPGVQCEACHGPGGGHVNNPSPSTINTLMDPEDTCYQCHTREPSNVIDALGGFTLSRQQADELDQSAHHMKDCVDCHDPHASAVYSHPVYNPDKGIHTSCAECHPHEADNLKSYTMQIVDVTCEECHMGPMVKSAVGDPSMYFGDMSNHIWKVNTSPTIDQFSAGGTVTNPYVTTYFVCKYCHIDGGESYDIAYGWLCSYSDGYHD